MLGKIQHFSRVHCTQPKWCTFYHPRGEGRYGGDYISKSYVGHDTQLYIVNIDLDEIYMQLIQNFKKNRWGILLGGGVWLVGWGLKFYHKINMWKHYPMFIESNVEQAMLFTMNLLITMNGFKQYFTPIYLQWNVVAVMRINLVLVVEQWACTQEQEKYGSFIYKQFH